MLLKLKQKIAKFRKKDFLVCAIMIVVFLIVLFYGNIKIYKDTMRQSIFNEGGTVMQLSEDTVYEQEVYLKEKTSAIAFKLATYETSIETGVFIVQLFDSNKDVVCEISYDAALIKDNQIFDVYFDNVIAKGDYIIRFELKDIGEQTIGIYLSKEGEYKDYNFYINSNADEYDIYLSGIYSGISMDVFSWLYNIFSM